MLLRIALARQRTRLTCDGNAMSPADKQEQLQARSVVFPPIKQLKLINITAQDSVLSHLIEHLPSLQYVTVLRKPSVNWPRRQRPDHPMRLARLITAGLHRALLKTSTMPERLTVVYRHNDWRWHNVKGNFASLLPFDRLGALLITPIC
jgi:hypothetical protein